MSITVSHSNDTIQITGTTANPSVVKLDEVMRALSQTLGRSLGAMKMCGIWVIADTSSGWNPLFGHQPGGQTRSFAAALEGALGKTVTFKR